LVNVSASIALTALWFQHSQMKPRFHHLLFIWCIWELHRHLCGITLLSLRKPKSFYAFCMHPWEFSEAILSKTCDSLA
jgi:hypothetical protein